MRIVSKRSARKWQDALISGNGSTGIMVFGDPLSERIIVNHENLWVVAVDVAREVTDMREAFIMARKLAKEQKFDEAEKLIRSHFSEHNRRAFPDTELVNGRLPVDRVHPGLQIELSTPESSPITGYSREIVLDTGEIIVTWEDSRGIWERSTFVSRTDDVIVLRVRCTRKGRVSCDLRLGEVPGKPIGDFRSVVIEHNDTEAYFSST